MNDSRSGGGSGAGGVGDDADDGFQTLERYRGFGEQVKATKRKLLALEGVVLL